MGKAGSCRPEGRQGGERAGEGGGIRRERRRRRRRKRTRTRRTRTRRTRRWRKRRRGFTKLSVLYTQQTGTAISKRYKKKEEKKKEEEEEEEDEDEEKKTKKKKKKEEEEEQQQQQQQQKAEEDDGTILLMHLSTSMSSFLITTRPWKRQTCQQGGVKVHNHHRSLKTPQSLQAWPAWRVPVTQAKQNASGTIFFV